MIEHREASNGKTSGGGSFAAEGGLICRRVDSGDAALHQLIARLDEDLERRYPAEGIFRLDFNSPKVKDVFFALAYEGERPVACGAFQPLDGQSAELKRFFVEPDCRNRGIASKLLVFLESNALDRGFSTMRLEAGEEQPEAVSLYAKRGYAVIPLYGEYIGSEYSLCMEKKLG
ncbi:GNAT family N-acetyltransferase [Paenibacillus pasadenensis]|uniref:GNAT family N-acetyltransferase n=1 Tax=Paenibacillus pasadenensis TaxID=217090 RepID=UPI00203DA905|nr:GNAT family N-acetyltransferase [Paenibacillus pasadenensis]MCM3748542.1 GNAT family N-acetyltransferase [Paenibacillus pasadenensis]